MVPYRGIPRDGDDSHASLDDSELEMQRRRTNALPVYVDTAVSAPGVTQRVQRHHRTPPRVPSTLHTLFQEVFFRPRNVFGLLKWLTLIAVVVGLVIGFLWEIHVEIMWYSRHWVRKEFATVEPLAGCFDKQRVSSAYNITSAMGPKRTDVQAGMPLRMGMDCYDFAGTIRGGDPASGARPGERRLFHTYWRVDLVPFAARQEWMIKSFFATQDLGASRLVLWSNGDLSGNALLQAWMGRYPEAFEVRVVDVEALARGTAMEGSRMLESHDGKAWVDGDLLRLLLLWNHGGVWVDMDSLLTRDLAPLLEHEFITQWDCYDKKYQPFNGALMHFFKHSPYLCEIFHLMVASPPPRSGTTDWGSLLYFKLWRRLVAGGVPPFKILPFCFSDARSCRMDNRLPDPFVKDARTWADGLGLQGEKSPLEVTLEKVFAVHLHNQWEKMFPRGGWVERYLLTKYDKALQSSS